MEKIRMYWVKSGEEVTEKEWRDHEKIGYYIDPFLGIVVQSVDLFKGTKRSVKEIDRWIDETMGKIMRQEIALTVELPKEVKGEEDKGFKVGDIIIEKEAGRFEVTKVKKNGNLLVKLIKGGGEYVIIDPENYQKESELLKEQRFDKEKLEILKRLIYVDLRDYMRAYKEGAISERDILIRKEILNELKSLISAKE